MTGHPASARVVFVLTDEHREVDEALEGFVEDLRRDDYRPGPVLDAMDELRRHIYLEEALLFPPLATGGLVMPIAVMLREHGQLWRAMDMLTVLLDGGDTAETRRRATGLCRTLLEQLDGHNVKEEQIVYASAETMLTAEELDELAAAIDGAPLPDDWVCQEAAAREA